MIAAEFFLTDMFSVVSVVMAFVFLWSTMILFVGLFRRSAVHPKAARKLRFAVLVCARNEERVIRLPVKSIMMTSYPRELRDVIVLADNCSDQTAARAREAGAIVWEKTVPSSGKGDVLAWGLEQVIACGAYDAVAVFDADNIVSAQWFDHMNDALNDGERIATGRRMSSNATKNVISGWYTVYWDLMNELSNRVRTNLNLSGKLTGTGFAFRLDLLDEKGWQTKTMVEDVEFSVQCNIRGCRIAYVPEAEYADEQPVTVHHMWRQLCRWATGCWQVVRLYFVPWLSALFDHFSFRLFDSYFAMLTGLSVAFLILLSFVTLVLRLISGRDPLLALFLFASSMAFVSLVSWVMACSAVLLSNKKRRPRWWAVMTFPVFSFVLSLTVLFTLVHPTRTWKPIPHGN